MKTAEQLMYEEGQAIAEGIGTGLKSVRYFKSPWPVQIIMDIGNRDWRSVNLILKCHLPKFGRT